LHLYYVENCTQECSRYYSDYVDLRSFWISSFYFTTSAQISAKVPTFRNQLVRAGTRVEFGIRRANYTSGYFVVLPTYGLRNDRLFINDLSLGTSWAITSGSSEVPHSDLVIGVLGSPVLFLSAEGPWHLSPIAAPEVLLSLFLESFRLDNRVASSVKRFTTWLVKHLRYLRD